MKSYILNVRLGTEHASKYYISVTDVSSLIVETNGKKNWKTTWKKKIFFKYLKRCLAQGTRQIHNRNNLTKQLKTLKKGEISVIH